MPALWQFLYLPVLNQYNSSFTQICSACLPLEETVWWGLAPGSVWLPECDGDGWSPQWHILPPAKHWGRRKALNHHRAQTKWSTRCYTILSSPPECAVHILLDTLYSVLYCTSQQNRTLSRNSGMICLYYAHNFTHKHLVMYSISQSCVSSTVHKITQNLCAISDWCIFSSLVSEPFHWGTLLQLLWDSLGVSAWWRRVHEFSVWC